VWVNFNVIHEKKGMGVVVGWPMLTLRRYSKALFHCWMTGSCWLQSAGGAEAIGRPRKAILIRPTSVAGPIESYVFKRSNQVRKYSPAGPWLVLQAK
jgi:hypothetical protein